ncbi:hypothetical protein PR202_ga28062 [Eleusine coracana subsp. coracana]|uniref:Myb/SANT-like domain-containing protein n=1 Tax=Eleusine coracana subsp. coracana TaxID=191504 RepID=A0AAV5DG78_ELECO|nr:hypothetical protein PR202_ga28062 [Eleusine coracana subsp. coracana]
MGGAPAPTLSATAWNIPSSGSWLAAPAPWTTAPMEAAPSDEVSLAMGSTVVPAPSATTSSGPYSGSWVATPRPWTTASSATCLFDEVSPGMGARSCHGVPTAPASSDSAWTTPSGPLLGFPSSSSHGVFPRLFLGTPDSGTTGLQDWFVAAATGALGSYWMSADPTVPAMFTGASTSAMIGGSMTGGGCATAATQDRAIGGSSAQRTGGRARQPLVPTTTASATAATEVEVDIELTTNTRLKSDYAIWKKLSKQTGVGWDANHNNIVMPNEWWKKMSNVIKGSARFKDKGLQHEDKLAVMFSDLLNTGEDHWSASSGVAPSCETSSGINLDEDSDDDSEPEEFTPISGQGAKRGLVSDST